MELALSLGNSGVDNTSVGFCMGLPSSSSTSRSTADNNRLRGGGDDIDENNTIVDDDDDHHEKTDNVGSSSSSDPSQLQLDLLPLSPVPLSRCTQPLASLRFPWLADNLSSEPGSSYRPATQLAEVNRRAAVGHTAEETEEQSSPNSGTSSFMEFSLYTSNNSGGAKGLLIRSENNNGGQELIGGSEHGGERGATTSRGSDDDENGSTRKKLRLSKEQSAFLEESFKEHHTLNPGTEEVLTQWAKTLTFYEWTYPKRACCKQKLALAKQLNLRPRQVEVWFQNRRARTKLKQTEVDCEYLKRCCETLTEENRRLQKELQELRALKTSQPFFMQLPATTLTMCPSCERVAPTSSSSVTVAATSDAPNTHSVAGTTTKPANGTTSGGGAGDVTLSLGKPKAAMLPFASSSQQAHKATS